MVENVADDRVEPKPTVNVKLKVKIPFQAHVGHIEEKSK